MEFISDVANGGDSGKPSVFEIIAQCKMNDLLEPALRHVISVYAYRYPRYLIWILNRHEEVFALIMSVVESHYLRRYGGSFTEHFYGMKRERARKIDGSSALTPGDRFRSLIFLVGLPLVKARLDQYYEKASGGAAARLLGPGFNMDDDDDDEEEEQVNEQASDTGSQYDHDDDQDPQEGIEDRYYIAYMFDKTSYNSPWLHLIGLQVRRLTMQDYRNMDTSKSDKNPLLAPSNGSPIRFVRNIIAKMLGGGLDFLKVALPMSIFFYKFLEWWYRSDFHKVSKQMPIPPPPNPIKPHPDGVGLPDNPNTCPICKEDRNNPAMLSTGYIDYTAIFS
ncbi:ubiquitin-protein ligase peroxin 12 [Mycoemilia scoparia]|uniref:Peroxisome assembly protein 12 n=1 Tax=Mycoemilia scoparia TaxID=417184 RepID=A0A9W8DJH9_9FUNG|nr:ubiquitin-protein ligase peroxin 12 [Mycoemilia scoparia]